MLGLVLECLDQTTAPTNQIYFYLTQTVIRLSYGFFGFFIIKKIDDYFLVTKYYIKFKLSLFNE